MELICKTGESRHKEELPMDIAQLADRLTAETAKILSLYTSDAADE